MLQNITKIRIKGHATTKKTERKTKTEHTTEFKDQNDSFCFFTKIEFCYCFSMYFICLMPHQENLNFSTEII